MNNNKKKKPFYEKEREDEVMSEISFYFRQMSGGEAASRDWAIKPFNDEVDQKKLRSEWEEWIDAFEFEAATKGVFSQEEMFNLLMTKGGRGIQRIYKNKLPVKKEITEIKPPRIEIPIHDNAVVRLEDYFVGKANKRVERTNFREMKQLKEEPFNKFVVRLRAQAGHCSFGKMEEDEIIDQIIRGAASQKVRDKGVDESITLDNLTAYALKQEKLAEQKNSTKRSHESDEEALVAKVERGQPEKRFKQGEACTRCGSKDHNSESQECRARSMRCFNCQGHGHLANFCRSKKRTGGGPRQKQKWVKPTNKWSKRPVQSVLENDDWEIEIPGPKKVDNE